MFINNIKQSIKQYCTANSVQPGVRELDRRTSDEQLIAFSVQPGWIERCCSACLQNAITGIVTLLAQNLSPKGQHDRAKNCFAYSHKAAPASMIINFKLHLSKL